jgi:hypothetical protein
LKIAEQKPAPTNRRFLIEIPKIPGQSTPRPLLIAYARVFVLIAP